MKINKGNVVYLMLDVAIAVSMFLAGLFAYPLAMAYLGGELEKPFSISTDGLSAPSNFIEREDILVYPDRIIINIEGTSLSSYADTGSMMPVLDGGSNGVRVRPESEKDINVGDIVSFRRGTSLIVHRVVEKGIDGEGIYFVTKGDGNSFNDGKIRFTDIEYKTVAIIY